MATPEKASQGEEDIVEIQKTSQGEEEEDIVEILDDEDCDGVEEVHQGQGAGGGDSWVGVVAPPGQKTKKKVVQVKVEDESEVSALKTLGFRVCS